MRCFEDERFVLFIFIGVLRNCWGISPTRIQTRTHAFLSLPRAHVIYRNFGGSCRDFRYSIRSASCRFSPCCAPPLSLSLLPPKVEMRTIKSLEGNAGGTEAGFFVTLFLDGWWSGAQIERVFDCDYSGWLKINNRQFSTLFS